MSRLDPGLKEFFTDRDANMLLAWCVATDRWVERTSDEPMYGHTGSVLIPVYLTSSTGVVKALLGGSIARRLRRGDSFITQVMTKGRVLYEAGHS